VQVLTFDEIKAIEDTDTLELPVPEWGEGKGVVIRRMSRDQFLETRQRATKIKMVDGQPQADFDQELWERWMLINGIAQPDINESRAVLLMRKDAQVVGRIVDAIAAFNKASASPAAEATQQKAAVDAAAAEFRQ
jgi:hypothetical protein